MVNHMVPIILDRKNSRLFLVTKHYLIQNHPIIDVVLNRGSDFITVKPEITVLAEMQEGYDSHIGIFKYATHMFAMPIPAPCEKIKTLTELFNSCKSLLRKIPMLEDTVTTVKVYSTEPDIYLYTIDGDVFISQSIRVVPRKQLQAVIKSLNNVSTSLQPKYVVVVHELLNYYIIDLIMDDTVVASFISEDGRIHPRHIRLLELHALIPG